MSSTFAGFSEEDLQRIKSETTDPNSAPKINITPQTNIKVIDKLGGSRKRTINQYKLPILQHQDSDDNIEKLFDKCKLSIKTPTSPNSINNNYETNEETKGEGEDTDSTAITDDFEDIENDKGGNTSVEEVNEVQRKTSTTSIDRKKSSDTAPDIVKSVDNYTEDEIAAHKAKLQELQLQQKIMEEQNKKRKEMLAKALADRTKQTEEEVLRLEKIKKELQVLDGQFSQEVAVLRKKIDQACLTYADAEKHYLKVEKEFLQAKIHLQKEKEKKELLTEHLCTLITHNETRKAQKLENLMTELASDKRLDLSVDDDEKQVVVDGVDQKTDAADEQ